MNWAESQEDREFLQRLPELPYQWNEGFSRPERVPVDWHETEHQGRMGSCFPAGTLVTGEGGLQYPIEKVSFGDTVLSHTGQLRQVVDTMSRVYSGTIVTFTIRGVGRISCTDDHAWLVLRDGRERWLQASEVLGSDQLLMSRGVPEQCVRHVDVTKYIQSPAVCDHGDQSVRAGGSGSTFVPRFWEVDDLLCSVLGLYVAEGSSGYSGVGTACRATWTFHRDEHELQEQVLEFARRVDLEAEVQDKPQSKARNIRISSVVVAEFFETVCGRFCNSKKVPEFILRGTRRQKLAFVRGYFSGDGSRSKYDRGMRAASGARTRSLQMSCATASKELAVSLRQVLVSMGMKPGCGLTKARAHQRFDSHAVYLFSVDAAEVIGETHPEPAGKSRKLVESVSGQARTLTRIETHYVESLPVYDLTVEEDHSFVADGMIVHNCQGNDLSSCLERLQHAQGVADPVELSRITAYLWSQKLDNLIGRDVGSTISSGIKVALTQGLPPESMTGYPSRYPNSSQRAALFRQDLFDAAEKYKAKSSWRVPQDYSACLDFIGGGGAISIGIAWPGIPRDRIIRSYSGGGGGHAVAWLGYESDGRATILNSWGDGPFWITETAFLQMMRHRRTAMAGLMGSLEAKPVNWLEDSPYYE